MNRSSIIGLLSILVATVIGSGASLGSAANAWTLVWADEFDQADGSAPDSSKWVYDLGGKGWGNRELETYTSRRTNSWIEGGKLIIAARQETFTGADGIPRDYTSARLKTQGKMAWAFGRLEARIQVPRGQGIWPAFWMLGTNFTTVGWPVCGEIDIMENIGREPNVVHGTVHGPGYSGDNGIGGAVTNLVPLADNFHVYGIEWEADRLSWFLDDKPYFTLTRANLPAGAKWVFDRPHYFILNLAVGGHWPGNPDSTTLFPKRMEVDYVRVYSRTNGTSLLPRASKASDQGGLAQSAEIPEK